MKTLVILVLLSACLICAQSAGNCSVPDAIKAFQQKTILNPYPRFDNDPYENMTADAQAIINATLSDQDLVCALKYSDESRKGYSLKQFQRAGDLEPGYIITHQGRCGACSNLIDLAVYLRQNLTGPTRSCGFKGFISSKWAFNCLKDIGFTDQCAQIWLYNTINTRKKCFTTCIISTMKNEPFNKPDGSLNDCLQCDEDLSGPVFKYYSGRTRRNSGIRSEIDRPNATIYNITHCYY
jgi:hypothetical protein